MKKQYNVSVIVPVYNVERYLEKCLDSLVNQTLDSLQIIIVNDGSTDKSQEIIDNYCHKYPDKIEAYIKPNGGLSDARNYGLQYALGEYIGFVDSDDWVDEKMYESMYQFAKKESYQMVICDLIVINDGWKTGHVSKGYRGENEYPDIQDFMLGCLDPAHAVNKLYFYQLFEIEKFSPIWYEDMATLPVLMSYSENIGYLRIPFYYYRQREGSITTVKRDIRSLQVIDAWKKIIDDCNKTYIHEVIGAVYRSIVSFVYFKPEFADEYIEFAQNNKKLFLDNVYVKSYLSNGLENLWEKSLIPKKIHYFWFGNNPKSELVLKCMESWKRWAPDYEIIEWNESNCDINECAYVREAYAAKKWAFVADYFRIKKIYEYGGIYVDTDIEFVSDIAPLRLNNAFFEFETKNAINACIFGAIKGFPLIKNWLDTYKNDHLLKADGTLDTSNTIVVRLTSILKKHYKLDLNGKEQTLKHDIKIYSPNVLILDMYDGKCITQHHYEASWWDAKVGCVSYKNEILKNYFVDSSQTLQSSSKEIKLLESEIQQLKCSTCWKITKPLRVIKDSIIKLKKG